MSIVLNVIINKEKRMENGRSSNMIHQENAQGQGDGMTRMTLNKEKMENNISTKNLLKKNRLKGQLNHLKQAVMKIRKM